METVRPVLILVPILLISLSCSRAAKDPDCVSREALTNVKLIIAADRGDVKVMNDMINAGADVNISDDVFGTPLAAAASSANYEAVRLLVDKGANVNATDGQGMTPLMLAAFSGNPEIARLLLSKGADANEVNKKRSGKLTALVIAKFKKNEVMVELLKQAGAKE